MVLMDLSKAYDCIPHDLLIAKLSAYGLGAKALDLLNSYLSDRKQRVKIGSTFSEFIEILIGIPQGSVLGPLLFNIFLNDLLLSYNATSICNFADDNTIYTCGSTIHGIKANLKKGIDILLKWFNDNSMKANPKKFQFMILSRGKLPSGINLEIDENIVIENQRQVKLLGVTLDSQLLFKNHVNLICDIAQRRFLALSRIRKFLNLNQAYALANSFIMSNFRYCNLVWMFCPKAENTRVNQIHKRVLRCVNNSPDKTLEELLIKHNIFSIHTQNLQSLMLFIFKIATGISPEVVSELFEFKSIKYSLRSKFLVNLPKCKSINNGTNTVFFKGGLLWNSLPNELKESKSIRLFQKNIRNWKPTTCTCKICI